MNVCKDSAVKQYTRKKKKKHQNKIPKYTIFCEVFNRSSRDLDTSTGSMLAKDLTSELLAHLVVSASCLDQVMQTQLKEKGMTTEEVHWHITNAVLRRNSAPMFAVKPQDVGIVCSSQLEERCSSFPHHTA